MWPPLSGRGEMQKKNRGSRASKRDKSNYADWNQFGVMFFRPERPMPQRTQHQKSEANTRSEYKLINRDWGLIALWRLELSRPYVRSGDIEPNWFIFPWPTNSHQFSTSEYCSSWKPPHHSSISSFFRCLASVRVTGSPTSFFSTLPLSRLSRSPFRFRASECCSSHRLLSPKRNGVEKVTISNYSDAWKGASFSKPISYAQVVFAFHSTTLNIWGKDILVDIRRELPIVPPTETQELEMQYLRIQEKGEKNTPITGKCFYRSQKSECVVFRGGIVGGRRCICVRLEKGNIRQKAFRSGPFFTFNFFGTQDNGEKCRLFPKPDFYL